MFDRVEVLLPVPTLQPYGVGTYQKVPRLPVVLTTGPGWTALPAEPPRGTAAAFTDLSERLSDARITPPLRPTVTVQTREGLELAWVNEVSLDGGCSMATASDPGPRFLTRVGAVGGPLAAQVAVWLTTTGHATSLREMNAARGWISSVGYGLHSAYFFSLALSILLTPALRRLASSHTLAIVGLGLLCAGSLLNGLYLHAPYDLAVFGRIVAGFGVGQVMRAAPRLLPAGRPWVVDQFEIALLAVAPPVVALVSVSYGWSNWEGTYLFQGLLAVFGLACVIPLDPEPEPPDPVRGSIAYWPALAIGIVCIWYLLQWGQLSGWSGDLTVLPRCMRWGGRSHRRSVACVARSTPALVRDGLPRVMLVGYAGLVQFFQVAETGVFGGLFINVGERERAWMVWPPRPRGGCADPGRPDDLAERALRGGAGP